MSITAEAFDLLEQLQTQVTNGASANVPTNIVDVKDGGPAATVFFVASAVRSRSALTIPENLR